MANRDGTGPFGQGPLTGRGMGPCGRGFRRGFEGEFGSDFVNPNFGRGRRFAWRAMPIQQVQPVIITQEQEKQYLEQELEDLKEEMNEIEKRLKKTKN